MSGEDPFLSHAEEVRDMDPSEDGTITIPAIKTYSLQKNNLDEFAENRDLSDFSEEDLTSIVKGQSEEIDSLRQKVDRLREESRENRRENTSIYDKEF